MKNFCESLIECIIKINDFKKKKMKLWTNEQNDSHWKCQNMLDL